MSNFSTTPKQAIAFPEVALIRKGNPKTASGVGKDLNDKFRVAFYPGVDPAISEAFTQAYGKTPTRIKAFIPFPHIREAFSSFNEAHNAGRMIAQADETHYLMRRDPLTGQYEIRNGEPFTPYQPGDKITYTRGDKTYELPLKTTNRLRLVIPEIVATGRLVTFTFKSTSLYDRFNLQQQLGAIQALANTLNRGNAAGIPFWLYRAEREITWNKADGTAARIKKWLVHLEPDADWVKNAWQRMSQMALTGGQSAILPATISEPLEVEEDFGDQDEDDDDDPGVFEGTARDVPPNPPPPTPARQPVPQTKRPSRPAAASIPRTLPPAPKAAPVMGAASPQASATPGSPLAEFNRLGNALWPCGKWEDVWPTITQKRNPASLAPEDLQKALTILTNKQAKLNDLDGLLAHIEKAWPSAVSFAPLAWGDVAARNGIVDPELFLTAVAKAAPELPKASQPRGGASMIVSHYPAPHPELEPELEAFPLPA